MESNVVQKMRTALRHCIEELSPYCDGGARIDDVLEEAKSAIAIPDRNCDVGTAEEQDARFVTWRYSNPLRTELGLDALEWAQMPYTESGVGE